MDKRKIHTYCRWLLSKTSKILNYTEVFGDYYYLSLSIAVTDKRKSHSLW